MTNNSSFSKEWEMSASKIGTIMIPLVMFCMFLPVIYLKLAYGVFPEWSVALSSWGTIAAAFGVYYLIEPLSYYPILGLSGTYMAFTAGSISDIRMPASAVAQEAVEVPFGSDEGAVASTLGVAGSLFTTLTVVFLTSLFGNQLIQFFPETVLTAIKSFTVPAVFGASYMLFAKFEPKLSFIILVTVPLFLLIADWQYGVYMIASVVVAILLSRLLYDKGLLAKDGES
ncbi:MAG: hypothetical protein SCK57_12195 [Bacillota bacterium]|nr:hypothetical protein [Bacillota bacterium]MDW7678414.1 hypothetical protein [Bacillota bacterium]